MVSAGGEKTFMITINLNKMTDKNSDQTIQMFDVIITTVLPKWNGAAESLRRIGLNTANRITIPCNNWDISILPNYFGKNQLTFDFRRK